MTPTRAESSSATAPIQQATPALHAQVSVTSRQFRRLLQRFVHTRVDNLLGLSPKRRETYRPENPADIADAIVSVETNDAVQAIAITYDFELI